MWLPCGLIIPYSHITKRLPFSRQWDNLELPEGAGESHAGMSTYIEGEIETSAHQMSPTRYHL